MYFLGVRITGNTRWWIDVGIQRPISILLLNSWTAEAKTKVTGWNMTCLNLFVMVSVTVQTATKHELLSLIITLIVTKQLLSNNKKYWHNYVIALLVFVYGLCIWKLNLHWAIIIDLQVQFPFFNANVLFK